MRKTYSVWIPGIMHGFMFTWGLKVFPITAVGKKIIRERMKISLLHCFISNN
jgi:hypothetical protein